MKTKRQFLDRRLVEKQPLPATLPDGGDPQEVNIFVIGVPWQSPECLVVGSSSPEAWKKAKAEKLITASEVVKSWGSGYPICGSMHLECSWGKGGVSNSDRCNPEPSCREDKDWYWRDHFAQQNVATSMTDLAKERKPSLGRPLKTGPPRGGEVSSFAHGVNWSFVINTADNFYYAGVKSTQDKLWSMMFEELYPDQSLQIPWLSSLGRGVIGSHGSVPRPGPNPTHPSVRCRHQPVHNQHVSDRGIQETKPFISLIMLDSQFQLWQTRHR
eukprot:s419_g5.t1